MTLPRSSMTHVDMPEDLQEHLLHRYCNLARKYQPVFDEMAFRKFVAVLALQRNAKILGAFVRLDKQLGKPKYMNMLPRIRSYVRQCFAQLGGKTQTHVQCNTPVK